MKRQNRLNSALIVLLFLQLVSCATIPKEATAVQPFDIDKYLGKWYEIARFDFTFERDLNNTTAVYSKNPDGTIQVNNQGYNTVKKSWQQSIGKAKFVRNKDQAMLKVSFFGPFYGGYNVLAIDEDYRYALVSGSNLKYLWILSRDKTIPNDIKSNYLNYAESIGFDTSKLIWVKHQEID